MKIQIETTVKNKLLHRNRTSILQAIESFEGKDIILTIEDVKKKRSSPQNSYYHGVIVPIVKKALHDAGHEMSSADVHELLKLRFLKEVILVDEESGEYIERIRSTTELTTWEFQEFMRAIKQWCAEYFHTDIPDPNQVLTINFDK